MIYYPSIQEASALLNTLNKISPISELFMSSHDAERWLTYHRHELPDEVTIAIGVSRLTIIHDNWDFVLKIGFLDEEDVSQIEIKRYKEIQHLRLQSLFKPIMLLFIYKSEFGVNIPIYVQERCETVEEEEIFKYAPDGWYVAEGRRGKDAGNQLLLAVRASLPRRVWLRFKHYINKYNLWDLHIGNWGIDMLGNLVVIDYGC